MTRDPTVGGHVIKLCHLSEKRLAEAEAAAAKKAVASVISNRRLTKKTRAEEVAEGSRAHPSPRPSRKATQGNINLR